MAEWKERGYVPDSDDEEEEGIELLIQDILTPATKPGEEQQGDSPESDNRQVALCSGHEIQAACSIKSEDPVKPVDTQYHDLTSSEKDVGHFPQQTENERDGSISNEEAVQKDGFSNRHSATINNTELEENRSSVVERLQNELRSGLDIIKKILTGSCATPENLSDNRSGLSSPLSSAKSFPAEDCPEGHTLDCESEGHLSSDNRYLEQCFAGSAGDRPKDLVNSKNGAQTSRRNLRQRNPIQLHPYALEGARYQQELLARGLKPVSLGAPFRRTTPEASETQNCDLGENSASDDSQDLMSSQQESSGPLQPMYNGAVGKRPTRYLIDAFGSDEELPDLEVILEGKHDSLMQPRRRSKGVHGANRTSKSIDRNNDFHIYDLPLDSAGFTLGGSLNDAVFQVPPSPPSTRSIQSSQSTETLPRPQTRKAAEKCGTQALPTPNISSAAQQSTEILLRSDDDSDAHAQETGMVVNSSGPDSHHSLEQGDSQILQFQRRIKGVLPASFFRLRAQQEIAEKGRVRRFSLSPDMDVGHLGVAHSLSRRNNIQLSPSTESNNAIVGLDDSSDEESSQESLEDPAASISHSGYYDVMEPVDGDIEEDNAIDMMIQPRLRKRKHPDSTKKRQRRIGGLGDVSNQPASERSGREGARKRRKAQHHLSVRGLRRKRKTSKATAPSLGPLDAPDYTNLPRVRQPQFLRLAARRARSSKTGGRQSPSCKYLRLATSADNLDANNELNNWRQGLLGQNTKVPPHALLRKPRYWDHSLTEQPHGRGPRQLLVPHSGQRHQSLGSIPPNQVEVKPPPLLRGRTEGVIQDHTGHSDQPSASSRTLLKEASDDGLPGSLQPSAPIHAHHQNRSGRGALLSSAIEFGKPREAQVESLVKFRTRRRIHNAFRGRLTFPQSDEAPRAATATHRDQEIAQPVKNAGAGSTAEDALKPTASRALRKRSPRQVHTTSLDTAWGLEHPGQTLNADLDDVDPLSGVVLTGLGSPEFSITSNFGVVPFREGAFLHEASFIGNGQLSTAIRNLVHQERSLIGSTSDVCAVIRSSPTRSPYRWGKWDDRVCQQFAAWFLELKDCLGSKNPQHQGLPCSSPQDVLAAISSLISYLSCHISFQDSQDLLAFTDAAILMSRELVSIVKDQMESSSSTLFPDLLSFSNMVLVLTFEIFCIMTSASANQRLEGEIHRTMVELALAILKVVFRDRLMVNTLGPLCPCRDLFSLEHHPEIDALVTINNLSKQRVLQIDIWDLITEALLSAVGFQPESLLTFQDYDSWWKGIFVALPLLELDTSGLLQRKSTAPGWNLVQRLLARFLHLFLPRRQKSGYSAKHYGRVLIQRCLQLVQVWGWEGGHSVIGALFDAYSSNGMNELFGETPGHHFCIPFGLAPGGHVHVEKTDSGFHTLLGLLSQTILNARKSDADPKLAKRVLRSLSARLVPTKGADLSTKKPPTLADIIALRNRFDLASVMYCAMPTDMKPNLRLFQSFIDFRNAHLEECKVALECWSRLVQHEVFNEATGDLAEQKTSTDQAPSNLPLLRGWHDAIITDLLAEYSSTGHKAVALAQQHPADTTERRYIFSNMRKPLAELLKEALRTSERGFGFCRNVKQATELFSQSTISNVLKLFDTEQPISTTIISAALQVVRAFTLKCVPHKSHPAPADQDSQEYGSWDDFDDIVMDDEALSRSDQDGFAYLLNEVHPMMRRFLSNVFGSDGMPDPGILKSTADCWYEVAYVLVSVKARSWSDFLVQYSTDSWESLRHTRQSQQYKIYFLAKILEEDNGYHESNRLHVFKLWISALCQPQKLLCWEHLLTSIILFHDPNNELLFNPPFAVRSNAGERLAISMGDLCERRTAMIYVVLRNMHRLLASSDVASLTSHRYGISDFREILTSIESTMKNSYQDLEADQQAQEEYQVFTNYIIQQMQLYVVDFHKINPFFTDPATSSAEAHAVTAALKRYSLTIQTTGVTKAMVLFLYNAGERAALNGNQDQFILQLNTALSDLSPEAIQRTENHGPDAALLTLFLQHLFPAYVDHAFHGPGHIIAAPMLQVLTYIYRNFRCRPDFWKSSLLQQLIIATECILCSAVNAFNSCEPNIILASSERLENFNELVSLIHAAMLRIYEAGQAFPNDLDVGNVLEIILVLNDKIIAVERPPDVDSDLLDIEPDQDVITALTIERSSISSYAEKELQNALNSTWRQGQSSGWEIIGRGHPRVVKTSRRITSVATADIELEQCKQRSRFVVRGFVEAFVRLDWWV